MTRYIETLYEHWKTSYLIKKELLRKRTKFQSMRILQTASCGRMLVLDGITQACELDEYVYHEMLAHLPMLAHGNCKRVLIIGGGDGGILREVLRHPVERVVMVELDEEVVLACKKYLPTLSAGAFDDPRAELIFDDGAKYVRKTPEKFDAVIVDSPDPIGPAKVLFATRFYKDVLRVLAPRGVAVRQAGVPSLQGEELTYTVQRMKSVFPYTGVYLAPVPTYVGGFFSFVMGARTAGAFRVSGKRLEERFKKAGLKTRYYNAEIHRACFALPNFVKELVK